jgi:hypothetical protein
VPPESYANAHSSVSKSIPADSLFLGSWSLVSFEHFHPSGKVLEPYGDSPIGSLLYQPDGHMSAQLCSSNPKRFATDDDSQAKAGEIVEAWQTYFGYWGTFDIRAEKGVIVHLVEGCSFPNWIGTKQLRYFRFDGPSRLILEAQSASGRYKLVWLRKLG